MLFSRTPTSTTVTVRDDLHYRGSSTSSQAHITLHTHWSFSSLMPVRLSSGLCVQVQVFQVLQKEMHGHCHGKQWTTCDNRYVTFIFPFWAPHDEGEVRYRDLQRTELSGVEGKERLEVLNGRAWEVFSRELGEVSICHESPLQVRVVVLQHSWIPWVSFLVH